jgi:hypothetical protein
MKSQVQNLGTQAGQPPLRAFAAMGLAAAVLIAWPGRSHAHEQHAHAVVVGAHEHVAIAGPAVHADWHGGVGVRVAGPGYHGGGGRWDRGWHGGHFGWWYIDSGVWTAYPYYSPYGYYPYYTYPAPYGYVTPESPAVNSNLPPPPQYWYYCDAARAYYPYVQTCPAGWRPVAAQPAPVTPPTAAPAPAAGSAAGSDMAPVPAPAAPQ